MSEPSPRTPLSRLELRCPPLPHTLVEAVELANQHDQIGVDTVTSMLERDPLVVARLLQTVNSAYYGLQRTVSSTERAVVMLGPVAVVGIVVGMSMLRLRSVLDGPASACFTRLIRHSVATAFLTRFLVDELGKELPARQADAPTKAGSSASFTAGLLHDFGKIILVYNFPEEAVSFYDGRALADQLDASDLREMESLLFGADHTEAGEFAALKLHFPAMLTSAIRYHHNPEKAGPDEEEKRVVSAVAVANAATRSMGHAFDDTTSWEECAAHPAWALFAPYAPPGLNTPEELIDVVKAQQEALDLYVDAFTVQSLPEPSPYRRQRQRGSARIRPMRRA